MDSKGLKCVFLDYAPNQKGYKCYDPTSRKKFISLEDTFEFVPFFSPSQSHPPRGSLGNGDSDDESPRPVPPYIFDHGSMIVINLKKVKVMLRGGVIRINQMSKTKVNLGGGGGKEVVHQKIYKSIRRKG